MDTGLTRPTLTHANRLSLITHKVKYKLRTCTRVGNGAVFCPAAGKAFQGHTCPGMLHVGLWLTAPMV